MTAPILQPDSVGVSKLASRYALQVDTGTTPETPEWTTVFGVSNFAPNVDFTTQDNSDFDSDGWASTVVTQRGWTITVTLQDKQYSDAQDPGQAALLQASDDLELAHVRYFDRNGGDEAYEGYASVQWNPQGGSATELATIQVVLNGQGAREKVTNPAAA